MLAFARETRLSESGPTGRATRVSSQGWSSVHPHASMPTSRRRPPLPRILQTLVSRRSAGVKPRHRRRRTASTGAIEQQLGHDPSSGSSDEPRIDHVRSDDVPNGVADARLPLPAVGRSLSGSARAGQVAEPERSRARYACAASWSSSRQRCQARRPRASRVRGVGRGGGGSRDGTPLRLYAEVPAHGAGCAGGSSAYGTPDVGRWPSASGFSERCLLTHRKPALSSPCGSGCAWPAANAAPRWAPTRGIRRRRRCARRIRAGLGRCRV